MNCTGALLYMYGEDLRWGGECIGDKSHIQLLHVPQERRRVRWEVAQSRHLIQFSSVGVPEHVAPVITGESVGVCP
jgi:hypothetical protein